MSWVWVERRALELLHDESLAEHGGATGLRDEGLLDSALARPKNLALYGDPDWAALAASYGLGLAKNHPFVDGNKRAALLATGMFLMLNGYRLTASQAHATVGMISVAAGELTEEGFSQWLRDHAVPRVAEHPRPHRPDAC
jgi:death on curing protein